MRVTCSSRSYTAVFLTRFCSSCSAACHGCFLRAYEGSFGLTGCYCYNCSQDSREFEQLEESGSPDIEKFWIQPAVIDQMCKFWCRSSQPLQPPVPPSKVTENHALPAVLVFESGCVSLECSLFVEWYSTTRDNPSLVAFSEKAGSMHKRIRLYWSRYFDFVYSSTPPSSVELFTGTKENMRVCPNDACGLSFRHEASVSAQSNTAVAFVCHADCPCDHSLDGLCELCRLPFQNHTRGVGPGRKCASSKNGLWLHQIDMKTECPYCHFSFCEKCFLPWSVSSKDGSKIKGHAGLLCATFKGIVDHDCDEDSFRQEQQIEQRAEAAKVSDRMRIAANAASEAAKAAAEEARILAQSGTKNCPRCGYGPVQHERGHHCHHVSCDACGFHFCFCCLSPFKLFGGGCQCPYFCNALCDCPPCTTCRFGTHCDLCSDEHCPPDGRSPYFRMPLNDVPAFEERRQRNHEAAVREFKVQHPTWPGIHQGFLARTIVFLQCFTR